jgi:hypothetical protein
LLPLVVLLAFVGGASAAAPVKDASIASPGVVVPDEVFYVTWTAPKQVRYRYGYAECPSAGWASYRFLQADGTIGPFEMASADPAFTWPTGVTECSVSLIDKHGDALASSGFQIEVVG